MTHPSHQGSTRRHFLASQSLGLGSLALAWLWHRESRAARQDRPELIAPKFDLRPKPPARRPQARAMISLWMQGGPSQIDLFDPKPALAPLDGQTFPGEVKYDNAAQASSKVLASPWKFQPHGECGMELSELIPHQAAIADDLCLIRSMHTGVNNHGQSIRALQSGSIAAGQPSLGSWLNFGLGSECDDLPAFLALIDPGQLPVQGVENWSNGWLPSIYQGTVIRPTEPRILNLTPPAERRGESQQQYLDYLEHLNRRFRDRHRDESDLDARIASYRLAAKMQVSAKEAMDLRDETAETKRLYGLEDDATRDYGTRCLIARRLIERGVRFVQVYTQNQFWDHHNNIRKSLPNACRKVDRPSAALVTDLKRRGLLDSTVVHWGGEMGRLPVIQNDAGLEKVGRDHNTYGFSMWLAGGGFRGGTIHGETDEFGHKATANPVSHHDYHATLLHLFGIEKEELAFRQNNRDRTLFEAGEGHVVNEILA